LLNVDSSLTFLCHSLWNENVVVKVGSQISAFVLLNSYIHYKGGYASMSVNWNDRMPCFDMAVSD
jgi:hypothetical protein